MDMESVLNERLDQMRNRSAAELRLLPKSSTETVQLNGEDIKLTVYLDHLEGDSYRVVIQGVRERWAGMTVKVVAKGFELASNGTKRDLEPKELYDFT